MKSKGVRIACGIGLSLLCVLYAYAWFVFLVNTMHPNGWAAVFIPWGLVYILSLLFLRDLICRKLSMSPKAYMGYVGLLPFAYAAVSSVVLWLANTLWVFFAWMMAGLFAVNAALLFVFHMLSKAACKAKQ